MRSLVISEYDNIAAVIEDGKALDFMISRNDYGVGDVYTVSVQNIMPSIDAAFVKLEEGRMGFLHANDIPGTGNLYDRLSPGQKLLVQIVKEPTGNKGPRVNLDMSIPGRYFVLSTESKGINVSRKIADYSERDRLKSIANLMKPEELGVVIRTEAAGRSKEELEEDFVGLWETWRKIVEKHDRNDGPGLVHRENDFLFTTLRDNFNANIDEIIVNSLQAKYRAEDFLKTWTGREISVVHYDNEEILEKSGLERELKSCLADRVDLPSGGYIIIQSTEALTAIDINSGRFTSSNTLQETVRRTNMEAAAEIARQMKLRNIGGMIIIDFIDMSDRGDRIAVTEVLETAVRSDKAKPQVGQLSDLCLTEITRKRSGQALKEVFGVECPHCQGLGVSFMIRGKTSAVTQPQQQQRNDRNNRNNNRNDRNSNRNERNNNRNDRNSNRNERNNNRSERNNNRNERNNNRNERNNSRNRNRDNNADKEAKAKTEASDKPAKDLTASKTFGVTHSHMVNSDAKTTTAVIEKPKAEKKEIKAKAESKAEKFEAKEEKSEAKVIKVDEAKSTTVVAKRTARTSKTLQRLKQRKVTTKKDSEAKADEPKAD